MRYTIRYSIRYQGSIGVEGVTSISGIKKDLMEKLMLGSQRTSNNLVIVSISNEKFSIGKSY